MSFFGKLFSGKDKENNESDYLDRAYESLGDDADLNPDNIFDRNAASDMSEEQYGEIYTAEESDGDFGVELSAVTDDYYDVEEESSAAEAAEDDGEFADITLGYEDEIIASDEPEHAAEIEQEAEEPVIDVNEEYAAAAAEEADDELVADAAYSAFDALKGDTDEMDVDEIFRAMNEAGEYAEQIKAGQDPQAAPEPEYENEDEVVELYGTEYEAPDNAEPADAGTDDEYDGSFGSLDNVGSDSAGEDAYSHDSFSLRGAQNLISQDDLAASSLLNNDIDKETLYSAYAPKSMRPKITETSYYDLDEPIDNDENEPGAVKKFLTKKKKWIIGIAAAAAVIAVTVGALMFAQYKLDPLKGYSETYITKGNIIKTMEAGGSVEPNARYNIIPMVGGTITESPLSAGDTVRAGELVYKIDDTNAQIAVQQAQNAVSRAQSADTTSSATEQVKVYANATGVISNLNISAGTRVTGGQIATITQANGTEIGLIPSVSGTVESVNVRNDSNVTSGQVVATLNSDRTTSGISAEDKQNNITAANLALEQAKKDLENYKIASPVDGTILVKNAKVGDSVIAGQNDQPLMVIGDMSKMKFTIEVDELDIWNIEQGQTVVITANALPGETFSGEITNIAGEGDKKGEGVTSYKVEITVSEPGKLKSGMNVDAKIIINSAINVLSLPEAALYQSDGENALVITDSDSGDEVDPSEYPEITLPKGYRLVKVKYGVSDGTDVEIVSGLSVGDAVLYKPAGDGEPSDEQSLATAQPRPTADAQSGADNSADDGENVKSTGKSATDEGLTDV